MAAGVSEVASPAAVDCLRWTTIQGVGPRVFARLMEHFSSPGEALAADVYALRSAGLRPAVAEEVVRSREASAQAAEAELALAARHGVRVICRDDECFPTALRYIPDPPICLYVRGQLLKADTVALAVVGARRCTIYGREQARRFSYALAGRGFTIVSGLARGVDSQAHRGALEAGGRTLAVLGNGLANIYPPEHREMADQIAEHGALISELPMTTAPSSKNFLPRNRIIAALSVGVLVVEAAKQSGSLRTARCALEYNREVFALPGRVDCEFSGGSNRLIRDHQAKLVTCPDDILDDLGEVGEALRHPPSAAPDPTVQETLRAALTDEERIILGALGREERSIDGLAEVTALPAGRLASLLIGLQLKGLVRQLAGGLFAATGRV